QQSVDIIDIEHHSVDGDAAAVEQQVNVIEWTAGAVTVYGDLTLANTVITDNTYTISRTIAARIESTAPMTATAEATLSLALVNSIEGVGIYNAGTLTVTHSTIAN